MQGHVLTTMECKTINKFEPCSEVVFSLVKEIKSYKLRETKNHKKSKRNERRKRMISTGGIRKVSYARGSLDRVLKIE